MEYQPHKLCLSDNQLVKIRRGHPIQLTATAMKGKGAKSYDVMLSPANHKKVVRCVKASKGGRLTISKDEIEQSGQGFKDILRTVGKHAKKFVKNQIKAHGPQIRKGIETALEKGAHAVGNYVGLGDEAEDIMSKVAPRISDFIGDQLGFGMIPVMTGSGVKLMKAPMKLMSSDDYSTMMSSSSPAMWPVASNLPDPGSYPTGKSPRGGSFRMP